MTVSSSPPTCAWCKQLHPEYTQVDPDDERRIIRVCRYCDAVLAERHAQKRKEKR
jgi:hypothetical protein